MRCRMNRDANGKLIGDVKFDEVGAYCRLDQSCAKGCRANDYHNADVSNRKICPKLLEQVNKWHKNI